MLLMEKIVAVLVLWSAGIGVFFCLVNRWVLMTRDFRAKMPLMLLAGVLLMGGGLVYGWRAGFSPLFWIVLLVLVLLLLGEVRRLQLRRALAGAPPVWRENVAEPLMQPFTTTTLAIQRYAVPLLAWHGPRLRVALVTDLHVSGVLPDSHYRLVMERVAAAEPDLIFLTGDFVSDPGFGTHLTGILSGVRGRFGTYAILGNHDYWADPAEVRAALHTAGVAVIGNGTRKLEIGGQPVALWGCEAPWGDTPWQPQERQADELVLALSHTADNIYRLAAAGAHAVFSGHYHAGQWRLPYFGPMMVPSRFGRRFDHGHFVVRGAHLFVSAGIGITRIPFRIYCRPDIFLVDILPVDNSPQGR